MQTGFHKAIVGAAMAFGLAWTLAAHAQGVDAGAMDLAALKAQTATPEQKRRFVAESLVLTPAEEKKFWPVYDAYQRKLDASNRAHALLIKETTNATRPVGNAYARQFVEQVREVEEADLRAQKALSNGVLKALPGAKAVRYLQIESKLRAAQRYTVASAMPLAKLP